MISGDSEDSVLIDAQNKETIPSGAVILFRDDDSAKLGSFWKKRSSKPPIIKVKIGFVWSKWSSNSNWNQDFRRSREVETSDAPGRGGFGSAFSVETLVKFSANWVRFVESLIHPRTYRGGLGRDMVAVVGPLLRA